MVFFLVNFYGFRVYFGLLLGVWDLRQGRVAIGRKVEETIGDRRGSNQYQSKELVVPGPQVQGVKTRDILGKRFIHVSAKYGRVAYPNSIR